jgi:hypothetical protein
MPRGQLAVTWQLQSRTASRVREMKMRRVKRMMMRQGLQRGRKAGVGAREVAGGGLVRPGGGEAGAEAVATRLVRTVKGRRMGTKKAVRMSSRRRRVAKHSGVLAEVARALLLREPSPKQELRSRQHQPQEAPHLPLAFLAGSQSSHVTACTAPSAAMASPSTCSTLLQRWGGQERVAMQEPVSTMLLAPLQLLTLTDACRYAACEELRVTLVGLHSPTAINRGAQRHVTSPSGLLGTCCSSLGPAHGM